MTDAVRRRRCRVAGTVRARVRAASRSRDDRGRGCSRYSRSGAASCSRSKNGCPTSNPAALRNEGVTRIVALELHLAARVVVVCRLECLSLRARICRVLKSVAQRHILRVGILPLLHVGERHTATSKRLRSVRWRISSHAASDSGVPTGPPCDGVGGLKPLCSPRELPGECNFLALGSSLYCCRVVPVKRPIVGRISISVYPGVVLPDG